MPYRPAVRHKSIRLKDYDYTTAGIYFVTICAINRRCIFGRVEGERVVPSDVGRLIEASWFDLPNHHPNVSLDLHVVMPNHFHGLIVLRDREDVGTSPMSSSGRARPGRAATEERFGRPVAGSLPTIIRSFKSASTRRVNLNRGMEGESIWQRNYYEHIIRNEDVLLRAREYIQINPLNWALDPENPERQQP